MLLGQNLVFAEMNSQNSEIISCNEKNKNEFCNSIDVTKKPIKLNSYLKKNNSGFIYTVTNKQEHPIEIYKVSRFHNPNDEISRFRKKRQSQRFPDNVGGLLLIAICPLAIVSVDAGEPNTNDLKIYYDALLSPIINTALTPYFWKKDPKEDKKAITESASFKDKFEKITLKQNESEKFAVLAPKKCLDYQITDEIEIDLKDLITGQKYVIYK